MSEKKHGQMTGIVGRRLRERLVGRLEVLYDHGTTGEEGVGELSVWFGEHYGTDTRLAVLDIAVVEMETDRVVMLVEIEESTSTPKTIIGDIFAALLGDGVRFQGERLLHVDEGTLLLVLVKGGKQGGDKSLVYLEQQANQVKGGVSSGNARLGSVLVRSFNGEDDLERLLVKELQIWGEGR